MVNKRLALAQAREDLRWASTWPGMSHTHPGRTKELVRESWRELARQTNAFVEYQDAFPNAARHTAFQSAYEPGSIMKVLTLAAWLDQDVHPIDYQYDLLGGEWDLEETAQAVCRSCDWVLERSLGEIALRVQEGRARCEPCGTELDIPPFVADVLRSLPEADGS